MERKYRPSLELELDQLVWYRVPGVEATVEVRVQQRWFALTLHYSLLTHSVEPVGCVRCGRQLRPVLLDRDGHPVCQEHAPGP